MKHAVQRYKHIIWDWNGTLLDDVGQAVAAMNVLLVKRGLPVLDVRRYKDIFTFPVADYYAELGFDFGAERFEDLASEYIAEFERYSFRLQDGAEDALSAIEKLGLEQSILSAARERELNLAVRGFCINGYFSYIAGLNDCFAAGKVERGRELIGRMNCSPGEVLLIGDTAHDFEVSQALGCACLLIGSGHQSQGRLSKLGAGIVDSIDGITEYFGN